MDPERREGRGSAPTPPRPKCRNRTLRRERPDMKRLCARLVLVAALVAPVAPFVSTPVAHAETPPAAGQYDWNRSSTDPIVWWRYQTFYDSATGLTWSGAEYWIDYGIYGHQIWDSFGPIRDKYANLGWEMGWLGRPAGKITYVGWGPTGPVYRQHFLNGWIDYYSNNLCRCYAYGGAAYAYRY